MDAILALSSDRSNYGVVRNCAEEHTPILRLGFIVCFCVAVSLAIYVLHDMHLRLPPRSDLAQQVFPRGRASCESRIHLTLRLVPRRYRWRSRSNLLLTTTMSSPSPALATSPEQNGFSDDATARARLLEVSTAILRQAVNLVEDSLTTDQQLTAHSNYIPGSTIGMYISRSSFSTELN